MTDFYNEVLKPFLTNEIVITWVSPIITGLIVVAIPAGIIWLLKTLQIKKDEKKIEEANQRFVNSIRPYIIQNIKILPKFITDTRSVVVKESGVKDKFIYSELSLRNKLIMDINESKYIDEDNKEKLIKFTYDTFSTFDVENIENNILENKKINIFAKYVNMPIIVFIISVILMVIIAVFDNSNVELAKNPLFGIPYLLSFMSAIAIVVSMFSNIFESKVTKKRNFDYYNEYIGMYTFLTEFRNKVVHNNLEKKDMKEKKSKNN